jgi:hypothetical protein
MHALFKVLQDNGVEMELTAQPETPIEESKAEAQEDSKDVEAEVPEAKEEAETKAEPVEETTD